MSLGNDVGRFPNLITRGSNPCAAAVVVCHVIHHMVSVAKAYWASPKHPSANVHINSHLVAVNCPTATLFLAQTKAVRWRRRSLWFTGTHCRFDPGGTIIRFVYKLVCRPILQARVRRASFEPKFTSKQASVQPCATQHASHSVYLTMQIWTWTTKNAVMLWSSKNAADLEMPHKEWLRFDPEGTIHERHRPPIKT